MVGTGILTNLSDLLLITMVDGIYDDYYGWLWYPDYEWAPAWVEWRYDNNYIGWAPLHPYAVFSVSVGIYFTNTYYTPYYHWNLCWLQIFL